jgi:predicted aspartyl protease
MKARLMINGKEIETIIDTGAGPNVITERLRRKLGIPITRKSKERCILADGKSIASLGKIELSIGVKDEGKLVKAEVIDSQAEELIIGNDALERMAAKIDFWNQTLWLMTDKGYYERIPVKYIQEEKYHQEYDMTNEYEENEEDEYEEENDEHENEEIRYEYDYEEGDKRQVYTIIRNESDTEEEDGEKEIVLAPRRERR